MELEMTNKALEHEITSRGLFGKKFEKVMDRINDNDERRLVLAHRLDELTKNEGGVNRYFDEYSKGEY